MQIQIAKLISFLFGIKVLPFFLFTIIFLKSGLSYQKLVYVYPVVLILQLFGPILYIYLGIRNGLASSWELPTIKERLPFLVVALISSTLSLIFIYFFGNRFLLDLNILVVLDLLLITAVTKFWKISFHASLITTAAILVNFLFNWNLPILYLLIPIVFWARIKLKYHTISQLLAGSLTSGGITIAGLKLFGYF